MFCSIISIERRPPNGQEETSKAGGGASEAQTRVFRPTVRWDPDGRQGRPAPPARQLVPHSANLRARHTRRALFLCKKFYEIIVPGKEVRMAERTKIVTQIAQSLNRRIIREKILAHRVPETLDDELGKHEIPEEELLAIRLEVDSLARKLRVEALRKKLA